MVYQKTCCVCGRTFETEQALRKFDTLECKEVWTKQRHDAWRAAHPQYYSLKMREYRRRVKE